MTAQLAEPLGASLCPIVAVVGATGTGKSDFALDLVEALATQGHRAEIINADAMQLYQGMDIGTAKLPSDQRRGIAHHLLDVWDVQKEASVAEYQSLARATIGSLQSAGVIPLLVGGSGAVVSRVSRVQPAAQVAPAYASCAAGGSAARCAKREHDSRPDVMSARLSSKRAGSGWRGHRESSSALAGWWSWRESNPRPRASNLVFSGCSL